MDMNTPPAEALSSDLIWGVKPISTVIGRTERQTYHMLVTGQLPARRIGGRWFASRSGLRQRFASILGVLG
jgi:hypothetical protein